MPYTLRRLFVTILVYCNPDNPKQLWEEFKEKLCEDYSKSSESLSIIERKALQHINRILESMGKCINDYNLIQSSICLNENNSDTTEIDEELEIEVSTNDKLLANQLNDRQKYAYESILHNVFNSKPAMYFIDGPGGTGKTFLYRALLATVRSKNLIALATASSGVAASILPGGRTTHSRFKIPINIENISTCNVSKQSALAKLLRLTSMIIWDEAAMANKRIIEAVDFLFKDICEDSNPFGGKVIVFGGDFRQVLPVIRKGRKQQIINSTLATSYLWPLFIKIKLIENMRAKLDPNFSNYLIRIGNGIEKEYKNHFVKIPAKMVIKYSESKASIEQLLCHIFPDLNNYVNNLDAMTSRAILTTKNEYVDEINNMLIDQFPGDVVKYYSFDELINNNEHNVSEEFLNSLVLNGIPPHELVLKENCPIMLLRNINPSEGLCNGTRLICRQFNKNVINAEIMNGEYRGKQVFLPRIPFIPNESDKSPFPFKRRQFPIRLCFAMTINKAQGQTLESVGIYLPEPVFAHGQLYVALSRAKTADAIKILMKPSLNRIHSNKTKNIVYKDLLRLIDELQ